MVYLYIKTHNKTGLKYLGKTTQDPFKYKGSGLVWTRHIKKYGYDVTTEVISTFNHNQELAEFATMLSETLDIVNSKEWANLRIESGDGGDTSKTEGFKIGVDKRKRSGTYTAWNKGKNIPRSKESIAKQKNTITGKKRGPYKNYRHDITSTPVIFRGVVYSSISEARRDTGASFYTVKRHSQILKQFQ
jgi:hypothetical protein